MASAIPKGDATGASAPGDGHPQTIWSQCRAFAVEEGIPAERNVRLYEDRLEVWGPENERLRRFARLSVSGVEVRESGGGAWLVVSLKDGSLHRIAMATAGSVEPLRRFAEQARAWMGRQASPHGGEQTGSFRPRSEKGRSGKWLKKFETAVSLLKYIKPHKGAVGVSVAALLLVSMLGVLPPYLMKMIVDGGLLEASESRFFQLIAVLFAVHLLLAMFDVIRSSIGIRVGMQIVSRMRKDMFDKLMKLSVRYYDQRKTAPFIGRIQYDAAHVEGFLTRAVPDLLAQMAMIAIVITMLFALDAETAAVLLGCIPLCLLAVRLIWPKVRSLTMRTWHAEYGLQQFISETLQGIRLIKSFRQEDAERQRFRRWNDAAVTRAAEQQRWSVWTKPGLQLAVSWAISGVWLVGGLQVMSGQATLGTIIAFTTYLTMFLGQMRWTLQAAGGTNRALVSAERIMDLLNMQEELTTGGGTVRLAKAEGEIRLQSVSFGYEAGHQVLHDISLHIRPGEKIGITGRTGAGKSTLIHLLCRFYEPDSGSIRIDGSDLREWAAEDLRKQIGLVLQDTYLFDGTIAQNIAYGKPGASMEEIMEAARLARAHDFIGRLPYGYDTRVGERGARLSGGEKQRISMARALLLDPAILILDEATSSMDAETEKELQEALETLCRGRTVVAIAHRLSTLRNADRIVVLENGRIAEIGSHAELEQRQGIYHRLLQANRLFMPGQEVVG